MSRYVLRRQSEFHSLAPPLRHDAYQHPIGAMWQEHDRQLRVSAWLLGNAEAQRFEPLDNMVHGLLGFFTEDLLLHHKDEEECLFPMLRSRCEPEDKIENVLAELNQDHATESFLMRNIVVDLRRAVEGRRIESPSRLFSTLRTFALGQERHISWENKVVLPLAEMRLTPTDLEALSETMASRWITTPSNR